VENIRLENERPVWLHNCTQCFACIQWCHLDAIEIKNKTLNRTRYHHPEIRLKEMILRKPAG
jgi:ferredoxin